MEEAVTYCIHFPEIRLSREKRENIVWRTLADSLKTDSLVGLRIVHISKARAFRASG